MKNFKKFAMLLVAVMAVGVTMTSCSNEDETIPVVNNVRATETLSSIISADKTLYSNVTYQLSGKTYVTNGATLTIQPGTRIEGLYSSDNTMASALIITRGCKIMAQGTADKPIVFTAQNGQKGGWGGLVILGKAVVNQGTECAIEGIDASTAPAGVDIHFGGTNDNDNSGVLSYVRVEYAGASIAADNELNAFTFGGVGRGTRLDHCQAFHGADDAFEFFGGCVNGKYLVSTATDDDGLDFDWGYTGTIQYGLITIEPTMKYSKDPNGVECDNDGHSSSLTPFTHPVLSNLTIKGTTKGQVAQVGKSGTALKSCTDFRRNCEFTLINSVVYGFPRGILRETKNSNYVLENNVICAASNGQVAGINFSADKATNDTFTPSASNVGLTDYSLIELNNPWGNYKTKALIPLGNPAMTGAYSLPGIEAVNYKGAFKPGLTTVWTAQAWVR
ncbi:hypothetical protein JCM15640A_00920 [Hoylesella timonensis 4401737 = DSM 22865 = JCM 15640]|uniref:hypothetical protein n=1 Tax=Hoylesella timonensis TaxID=386414 RepID=UPI0004698A7F|nr:hypothetical protein [Hoylesella timonensis]